MIVVDLWVVVGLAMGGFVVGLLILVGILVLWERFRR